jgi:hypothetical protein
MEADETTAETLAGLSEPFGFAEVRALARAERARVAEDLHRMSANGSTRRGHIRLDGGRVSGIFRPPYWMVVADPGS